jgi:serine/threonine protein kinase/tetratricopeptide (TPR) repeat protein
MDVTVAEGNVERTLDSPASGANVTTAALSPGQMVGRYEVLALLGQGGMGTVFTARDPDLERTVALKLLHAAMDDQRLEREARGLARVSHPNVIAVYDVGRSLGRLFVAMEFVEGLTLRKWLASERRSDQAILSVFVQAGRGLEAAHGAGLVHRDFKPDNVLIGHDGRVRVLDFGLVGGVSSGPEPPFVGSSPPSPTYDYDSAPGARLTANGSVLGTPAYMAPEQYVTGTPDPRSDQFSYCVALWEALYGRRPFESGSILDLMMRLRTGPPPEAPRGSTVPAWLERLLRRGLSRQPEARFASMTELLSRLEASLERTRAREQLIGHRYRQIGPSFDDGLRAIDTFTDQQVVLKPTSRPLDFELLGSFEHPNVVHVVDVARSASGEGDYLVLDLAQPSKTFEEAAKSVPLSIRLEWLSELLRALLYLHCRRAGHAPPRLSDVLIVGGRVRLLVTRLGDAAPEAAVSRDLAFVGTLLAQLSELSPAFGLVARELCLPAGAGQPADAAEALRALGRASERLLVVENAETRESLLRAMPLGGRGDAAFALGSALTELLTGQGAAFFIEGESGVGKSRLLEDFRRTVAASGVLSLEGRGEASERSPYRLFRLPLLRLSLRGGSEALDDFQLEALAPLIPELPARLGRAAKALLPVDAEPARDGLSAVAVALFRAQREPMVLFLEDLQWSGSESFALLDELVALTATQPLLIVSSCRSEERRLCPALPAAMRALELSRFTAADIRDACSALLGGNQPAPPELVSLLLRETEGNAFFLVEALRALAEEAGSLDALRSAALPARIFAGGIQTLIRRHLAAVSERGRPLLRAAAVLGRTMDPAVLRALEPGVDVDAWIRECVAAAVLERVEGGRDIGIRFRHDKLREALLEELDGDELRELHARVAAALERTRADESQHLAPLARHFQAAGNDVKELEFTAQAGAQALHSRAYTEAAELLERATLLAQRVPRPELLPHLRALKAELHAQRSEWARAETEIEAAFAIAGRSLWEKRFGNLVFFLVQLVIHLVRSAGLAGSGGGDPRRAALSPALVRAADVQLNIALTLGDNLLALGTSLLAMNVSERGRNVSVRALLLLALAARVARLRGVTRRYIERAHELLPLTTDRKDLSEALSYFGLYWLGEGKLSRAREYLMRSVDASASIGYHQPLAWSLGQLSMCASLQGRWVEMLKQSEMCESHTSVGDATHVANRCSQVLALARLGRLDEASERMATLSGPSGADSPLTSAIRAATTAELLLKRGQLPDALSSAERAHDFLPWASQVPPVWSDVLTTPIEVYLAAWQAAVQADPSRAGRLGRVARRRIRALQSWARIYPVAQPLADYYSGQAEALSGHDARAVELWQRARAGAKARGLADYERLSAAALATPRRALQSIAM